MQLVPNTGLGNEYDTMQCNVSRFGKFFKIKSDCRYRTDCKKQPTTYKLIAHEINVQMDF